MPLDNLHKCPYGYTHLCNSAIIITQLLIVEHHAILCGINVEIARPGNWWVGGWRRFLHIFNLFPGVANKRPLADEQTVASKKVCLEPTVPRLVN